MDRDIVNLIHYLYHHAKIDLASLNARQRLVLDCPADTLSPLEQCGIIMDKRGIVELSPIVAEGVKSFVDK